MRLVVFVSGWVTVVALYIVLHGVILVNHMHQIDLKNNVDSSMDYALDRLGDYYSDEEFYQYEELRRRRIVEDMMSDFCNVFQKGMASDAKAKVELVGLQLDEGMLSVRVTQTHSTHWNHHERTYLYEKTYCFV